MEILASNYKFGNNNPDPLSEEDIYQAGHY